MPTDFKTFWYQLWLDIGLVDFASRISGCDWSKIDPAIFGSMFQEVMDADQRRRI
ncbi:MAG: hypothetical protein FWG02_10770 [Holophagaceae bacterium]|nr:hypothetical protein [Holophagaceae bacterium]